MFIVLHEINVCDFMKRFYYLTMERISVLRIITEIYYHPARFRRSINHQAFASVLASSLCDQCSSRARIHATAHVDNTCRSENAGNVHSFPSRGDARRSLATDASRRGTLARLDYEPRRVVFEDGRPYVCKRR